MHFGFPPRHRAVRIFCGRLTAAAIGLGFSMFFGGCASRQAALNRDLFLQRAPLPTLVPSDQVMAAASRQAAANEGDFTLFGTGRSMEPYYRAGTAVVVHPTSFHMLRPGMAVVYANRRGGYVAHMLMQKTERGWVAMGLNNAEPDDGFVTEKNLIGIIKHAFAASDSDFTPDAAARIAANQPLRREALFLEPKH